jgi:hypothetical protein
MIVDYAASRALPRATEWMLTHFKNSATTTAETVASPTTPASNKTESTQNS